MSEKKRKRGKGNGLYQAVWTVLRRRSVIYDELLQELQPEFENMNSNRVRELMSLLVRTGFVERRREGDINLYGRPTDRYYLARDLGPLVPSFRSDGAVYDQNTGKVVGAYNTYKKIPSARAEIQADEHNHAQWSPFKGLWEANPRLIHPRLLAGARARAAVFFMGARV